MFTTGSLSCSYPLSQNQEQIHFLTPKHCLRADNRLNEFTLKMFTLTYLTYNVSFSVVKKLLSHFWFGSRPLRSFSHFVLAFSLRARFCASRSLLRFALMHFRASRSVSSTCMSIKKLTRSHYHQLQRPTLYKQ